AKWYYILHGYARCDYYLDDTIPFDNAITIAEFETLHETYYNHEGSSLYEWLLIANKEDISYPYWYIGFHYVDTSGYDWGIVLYDYSLAYNANQQTGTDFLNWAKCGFLHEFGHHAGILDTDSGGEKYCSNYACCMASESDDNAIDAPWYCSFHWSLRNSNFR
ncbi:MAG: hypothetical protein P1Q69_00490, partial [Candidatus Thorarchaeota archaeon]|nr:hypothetical protein [Candidatus Thorarchaeota archaeon]